MNAVSIVAVDWSGAARGARRKIWLAEVSGGRLVRVECGRDRAEIVAHLIELAAARAELVVGLDFAFSFPATFFELHGVATVREMWELVASRAEQWIADCPAPFWGKRGKPRTELARELGPYRATESDRVSVGGVGPKSVFQIGGAGSVGTGSLRGMPWLAELARAGFAIWPFDRARMPLVLEIYPRYLTGRVTKKDRAARALYLATHCASESRALLDVAAASEDAFDAAVSALSMARHLDQILALARASEPRRALEGAIWTPIADPCARAVRWSAGSEAER